MKKKNSGFHPVEAKMILNFYFFFVLPGSSEILLTDFTKDMHIFCCQFIFFCTKNPVSKYIPQFSIKKANSLRKKYIISLSSMAKGHQQFLLVYDHMKYIIAA